MERVVEQIHQSYVVELESGQIVSCNVQDLYSAQLPFISSSNNMEETPPTVNKGVKGNAEEQSLIQPNGRKCADRQQTYSNTGTNLRLSEQLKPIMQTASPKAATSEALPQRATRMSM